MSQVNLLPPDILQRQGTRKLATTIVVGGLVLLGLILAFYLLQANRLAGVNDDIEAQERTNTSIEQEIDALEPFADLQVEADQAVEMLRNAYAGEMSFSQALMDMSRITPSDSYLQSLAVGLESPTVDGDVTFVGTLAFNAQAIGIDTVALWISRVEEIEGWVNPWIATVETTDSSLDIRTFPVNADLTSEALTARGRGDMGDTGG
ncbi:MAG TPA: hypothetical protein VE032_11615 [Actinomycetota bacterium]|nr:hypothetical protein [Actinomycetota bacterium]